MSAGHGLQRAAARNPGVIDQNIQPAEGARRLRDRILNRLRAGAVGLNRLAVSPQRVDLIDNLLGFIDGFFVGDNHIGTGACQRQRNRPTQPTTGASNQRLLPVKSICMMTSLQEWRESSLGIARRRD